MIDLDILVILDRSGSMNTGREDHEGGLRSFVRDQRDLDGAVRFTLVQFDDHNPCDVVFDRVPLVDVPEDGIRLIPRGGTPLHAAVGRAIAHLEDRQLQAPSAQTVVMVITDGEDTGGNGEWTKPLVQARVKALEAKGASVLYLGANVDAFTEAAQLGASATMSANYHPTTVGSTQAMYTTVSNKLAGTRRMSRTLRASGMSAVQSATMSGLALNFVKSDYDNISTGAPVKFDGGAQVSLDVSEQAVVDALDVINASTTTGNADNKQE